MKKVLVIDQHRSMKDDIKLQLIVENIEDRYTIDAYNPQNGNDLGDFMGGKFYDFALVEQAMLDRVSKADFGTVKVYGYTSKNETPDKFAASNIPYMGNASTSSEIIHVIDEVTAGKVPEQKEEVPEQKETPVVQQARKPEPVKSTKPSIQDMLDGEDEEEVVYEENPSSKKPPVQASVAEEPVVEKPKEEAPKQEIQKTTPPPSVRPTSANNRVELKGDLMRDAEVEKVEEGLEKYYSDVPVKEKKTRVISIWSMKGGTGKSTLASNIALYLSMIDNGRSKYKVCLVDYNIESGDVRSILGFHGNKIKDMSIWAEDIHQQISHGRRPQDISFTQEQINKYLEDYHEKTGLKVLLAPDLHQNAQYIEANEIQIMLDNIINYGGFDFVVCDTADNTSDSSYYAIEKSEMVLLVCTQDVTTANRNDSALRSLKLSGIDMSKFKVIINEVTSRKKAGVSVQEVENHFSEYECIGRVHESSDVVHANNYSKPLVLKPNHEFTSDLRPVVEYILKRNDAQLKQGFFSKLFALFKELFTKQS